MQCAPHLSVTEKSVVAFTLHFKLLCSAHYTALQMKNTMRSISAINPVTMENTDDFYLL